VSGLLGSGSAHIFIGLQFQSECRSDTKSSRLTCLRYKTDMNGTEVTRLKYVLETDKDKV